MGILGHPGAVSRVGIEGGKGFQGWAREPFKVIPLFCTAQPLLRITLRHPRWRQFFPLTREEQTRAAFAELKLSFVIRMLQIG